ncbi:hypothetical protein CGMCC3_g6705 [Colletotrichum fructicola]|nr:uncharacterized protein CGMCC3_g6705 [Colletotrichum fructicola]KAE9577239.1 hypothetical protein CGMCC3_g6705 [Colletotrichum fructicola]
MPGSSTATFSPFAAPQSVSPSLSMIEYLFTQSQTYCSQGLFDDFMDWSLPIDAASIYPLEPILELVSADGPPTTSEVLSPPGIQNTLYSSQHYLRQLDGNCDILCTGDSRSTEDANDNIQDAGPRPQVKGDALNPDGTRQVHDCATEALSLLKNLHISASDCLTVVQRPPRLLAIEGDYKSGERDVGDMLSENGKALARLNNLLGCPCSSKQEILILTYLVIARIADSYSQILGINDSTEPTLLLGRQKPEGPQRAPGPDAVGGTHRS